MYRFGIVALALIQIAGVLALTRSFGQMGFDDAFISYRYALNLVEGHGLVFNPGERVEGYSNFLFTLFMAIGLLVMPMESIYAWAVAFNILCMTGALLVFAQLVRERFGAKTALFAGGLFAANPMLWNAAWSGMETPLVLLLFIAMWYGVHRLETGQSNGIALLAGASSLQVLARADGFVLVVIVLVCLGWRSHWRAMSITGVAAGLTFGLHVAGRYAYYGYPLPNTYYVKVSGPLHERIEFALRQINYYPAVTFMVAVIAVGLAAACLVIMVYRRDPRRMVPFELAFPVGWLAYWCYIGGDILGPRFLLPLMPIGYVLVVGHVIPRLPWRFTAAGFAIVLLWLPFKTPIVYTDELTVDSWAELGRFFGERYPDAVIAVDAAGKIPYFSRLYTIDMLGLNDLVIGRKEVDFFIPGHNKKDPAYVLSREPDFIASWLLFGSQDFGDDFPQTLWEAHGYRMAYLVHVWYGNPPAGTIVPVHGLSKNTIEEAHYVGYRFGIIAKPGVPVDPPTHYFD